MVREDKILKVEDIKKVLESRRGVIFTDHTGLKAEDIFQVRNRLAEVNSYIKIIKNTLALLAAKQVYENIDFSEVFRGPTSMVVSGDDIISTSRLVKDLTKIYETFKIKGGLLDGNLINGESIQRIANLPSKEVLIMQFMGLIQAPILRLLFVLKSNIRNLVILLDMIKKQKGI